MEKPQMESTPQTDIEQARAKLDEIGALPIPDPILRKIVEMSRQQDELGRQINEFARVGAELAGAPADWVIYHLAAGYTPNSAEAKQAAARLAALLRQNEG